MRVRAVVAIVSLLLPAVSSAQRFPVPRTGGDPTWPAPLPRQPESIARELAYTRLRLSVESYSLISYFRSPAFATDGRTSTWATLGAGTRAEYRLTPNVSATLDLTSSFLGSPVEMQTAEIGARIHPERSGHSERRAFPFVDVRAGYVSAFDRSLDDPFGFSSNRGVYGARYSQGFGGVAGVGMEYTLTPTLSLMTSGSVMRSRLTAHDFQGPQSASPKFEMTSYRYMLGIRYNWIRLSQVPGTDRP